MKKISIKIFSLIISSIFVLTIGVFVISLAVEFNSGKSKSQTQFTTVTRNISSLLQSNEINSNNFSKEFLKCLGDVSNVSSISLKDKDSVILSYPKKENSSSSFFIRTYSTTVNSYLLTASFYLLKPSSIFYKGRICFLIILAATLSCVLFLIIYSMNNNSTNDSYSLDTNEDDKNRPNLNSPFTSEKIISNKNILDEIDNDFNNIDTTIPIDDKKNEEGSDDLSDIKEMIPEEISSEDSAQENADKEESKAATFEQKNKAEEQEEQLENSTELSSDVFGENSNMISKLQKELVIAASSEQDLSLFTIRIPCIDWKNKTSSEIKSFITATFKYNDLIFDYKDDGCIAIMQNTNIDKALQIGEDLHIALTSILSKSGMNLSIGIGISSRSIRLISAERLANESEQALLHALEDKDSPVIAFRVDPQKYREYLAAESSK
ncbi:MAG: hypothetical protein WCQ67_00525 [Treponema sp.]